MPPWESAPMLNASNSINLSRFKSESSLEFRNRAPFPKGRFASSYQCADWMNDSRAFNALTFCPLHEKQIVIKWRGKGVNLRKDKENPGG